MLSQHSGSIEELNGEKLRSERRFDCGREKKKETHSTRPNARNGNFAQRLVLHDVKPSNDEPNM